MDVQLCQSTPLTGAARIAESRSRGEATVLDAGEWQSEVASRKNDDGSVSLVTIRPSVDGFELLVADENGARGLVLRDAQHEYRFTEVK